VNDSQRACSDFRTKLPIQSSHTPKFPQDRKITGGKLGVSRPISSQYDILISEQKWLNMFWAKNAHTLKLDHNRGFANLRMSSSFRLPGACFAPRFQRIVYSEVYHCTACGGRLAIHHRYLSALFVNNFRFIFSRYTQCVSCGRARRTSILLVEKSAGLDSAARRRSAPGVSPMRPAVF